jgi:hypothetical protein
MVVWNLSADSSTARWVFARPLRTGGAPGGSTRRLALTARGVPDEHSPAVDASASGRTLVVWIERGRVTFARYAP